MKEQLYTVEEIKVQFRVTRQTVYNWITSGALPAIKVGRSLRVTQSALDQFIKTREPKEAAAGE